MTVLKNMKEKCLLVVSREVLVVMPDEHTEENGQLWGGRGEGRGGGGMGKGEGKGEGRGGEGRGEGRGGEGRGGEGRGGEGRGGEGRGGGSGFVLQVYMKVHVYSTRGKKEKGKGEKKEP